MGCITGRGMVHLLVTLICHAGRSLNTCLIIAPPRERTHPGGMFNSRADPSPSDAIREDESLRVGDGTASLTQGLIPGCECTLIDSYD